MTATPPATDRPMIEPIFKPPTLDWGRADCVPVGWEMEVSTIVSVVTKDDIDVVTTVTWDASGWEEDATPTPKACSDAPMDSTGTSWAFMNEIVI